MKKALVLGVLAFFAINIATVNAQDKTNVQQKPKKGYTQEPAAKKTTVETKAVQPTKTTEIQEVKNVSPAPAPTKVKQLPKNASKNEIGKAVVNKNIEGVDPNSSENAKIEKKSDAKKVNANATKNVNNTKQINNNVPPKNNNTKTAGKAASSKTTK